MTGLIIDPGFNINRTEEYKLSIQVSLNGFSFSVVHEVDNKILVVHNSNWKISSDTFLGRHFDEMINNNELLQKKYKTIVVRYYTNSFTFVPFKYFDNQQHKPTGTLVLGDQDEKIFIDHYLQNADGNVVFPVPADFYKVLNKRFPDIKLQHPLEVLDNETSKLSGIKENILTLFFDEQSFILLLCSNKKPLIMSSYPFNDPVDVIFYIISAMNKAEITADDTALVLAGNIIYQSDLYNNLKKYFKNSRFITTTYKYNNELFTEPLYRFPVLF